MCGIAGIVSVHSAADDGRVDPSGLWDLVNAVESCTYDACTLESRSLSESYLGGHGAMDRLRGEIRRLKEDAPFFSVFSTPDLQRTLENIARHLGEFVARESELLARNIGFLNPGEADAMYERLEMLRDIQWCMEREIVDAIQRIKALMYRLHAPEAVTRIFRRINAVLSSIDRLEVRGRDSAGISLLFVMAKSEYDSFADTLDKANFLEQFRRRSEGDILENLSIGVRESADGGQERVAITFVYKVAAEIGGLGDNVAFLREQIKNDPVLQAVVNFRHDHFTVFSHTRWASVGAISVPNCHPVDNRAVLTESTSRSHADGIIHVCLNGDIDNYLELKFQHESDGRVIHPDITTDTKLIPLQVEKYVREGAAVAEAFRRAVNSFEGSHAVCMHTDLAPGKLFLAQRGSGQAIFVGLAPNHYIAASELYGLIEETHRYLKLEGEKSIEGPNGPVQGRIFVLDQDSPGGLAGITAMAYDGTPIPLTEADVRETPITSRDIDRQGFPHYFLKEISESPVSVERTLRNRWHVADRQTGRHELLLDERAVPASVATALREGRIRRVFFVGQGTAGVAAQACADIMDHYMANPLLSVRALKASELSGFRLTDEAGGMSDCLVIAISQSGTTTDTNRTVDMVRERGAFTLGIVNRRDSDLTFKVSGVLYTSSGRDIEMSVASTKAFYAQIVAGALLSLHLARLTGRRDDAFVSAELRNLLALPDKMRQVLTLKDAIRHSADRHAVSRTYWAAVGSGPNKTSSDEIRIKLSELCYKTISSDFVEDKKHIDLSSEPLILVCAAGTRETVLGDIIKDTAIFRAHKAVPIVIADAGEARFDPYAADVFPVPSTPEHLAPIVNTLAGHLWGYYAALAINEGSRFLFGFREKVQRMVEERLSGGDLYELMLEKGFREEMALFYQEFRERQRTNRLPVAIGLNLSSDIAILLKYLTGRLPVTDFELDFGAKGTPRNMLELLFERLNTAINNMARPVDAIKHQAKTVTVGTSRLSERLEGLLFDALTSRGFKTAQVTPSNIIVLKNLQKIISEVVGATLYRVRGLNLLGEPTDASTIEVLVKEGTSAAIPSRVNQDNHLRGSKRLIVEAGNVYIGKGRRDDRSILVIPLLSEAPDRTTAIEHLLLLHVRFRDHVILEDKVRALGGKLAKIRGFVQENNIPWDDAHLERVDISELFGRSAEKIAEFIVDQAK